jgi:hypothetical protein
VTKNVGLCGFAPAAGRGRVTFCVTRCGRSRVFGGRMAVFGAGTTPAFRGIVPAPNPVSPKESLP